MRARRATVAAALAASVALLLSGCVSWPFGVQRSIPEPVPSTMASDLGEFYAQELEWRRCGDGMWCATAEAPLDWDAPGAGSVELALVRHAATGEKVGSLLVNPGGPGASGVDFIADSLDYAVGDAVQAAYDVVGFDPRGVGQSTAVDCFADAEAKDAYLYSIARSERGTDAWLAEARAEQEDYSAACAERSGELLANIGTGSAARDLDLLRALLGDEELHYLGYSYGSTLGVTYAGLYPERIGRMVLDAVLDPSTPDFEISKTQAIGFERALRSYLASCLAGDECPFRGSVDDAAATVRALLDSVEASPLRAADGRMLGANTLVTAILYPLYDEASWPFLDILFEQVMFGSAEAAFISADAYNGRDEDGNYLDNSSEAFHAINCVDHAGDPDDVAGMRERVAELEAAAPVLGTYFGYGDLSCAGWPAPPVESDEIVTAAGAPPILVVGTTNDPATPYEWAVTLAEQLETGVLVTYEGEGHAAYPSRDPCVVAAVEGYLVDGIVPDGDPMC
ncbi:alpha/beta hydrolase [Agromyces rhizosphaerae]|uniref:Alpha/beta hydrolase n=1 Tax=Agromyces rhizosphaerae TaxID=88374 RepID=A0A9W6CPK5_9MICO|nr:alpha/beta hydrolase [Agromyces rhizosphaerae]GLI26173.1 alpha/beta hydrolase [Agromyces rhizosphaerae]